MAEPAGGHGHGQGEHHSQPSNSRHSGASDADMALEADRAAGTRRRSSAASAPVFRLPTATSPARDAAATMVALPGSIADEGFGSGRQHQNPLQQTDADDAKLDGGSGGGGGEEEEGTSKDYAAILRDVEAMVARSNLVYGSGSGAEAELRAPEPSYAEAGEHLPGTAPHSRRSSRGSGGASGSASRRSSSTPGTRRGSAAEQPLAAVVVQSDDQPHTRARTGAGAADAGAGVGAGSDRKPVGNSTGSLGHMGGSWQGSSNMGFDFNVKDDENATDAEKEMNRSIRSAISELNSSRRSVIPRTTQAGMLDVAEVIHHLNKKDLLTGSKWQRDIVYERYSAKWWRMQLQRFVTNPWTERFILLTIIVNCVLLATWDPLDTNPHSTHNKFLDAADWVFQIIYTIEMVLKLLAFGACCGPQAYFRQGWNYIDAIVVVLGWVAYMPLGTDDTSFNSLRFVRIMRPLKTIQAVPGLKFVINSMIDSLPQLLNVTGLALFFFVLFGVAGIQLFGGQLDQRCRVPGLPHFVPPGEDGQLCSLSGFDRQCGVWNGTQLECMHTGDTPNSGITSFDNVGFAFLTVFQCITLEGWVDVMYWVDDTTGSFSAVYFVLLVLLGSIFLLNLVVAVIVTTLSVEHDTEELDKAKELIKEHERAELTDIIGDTVATPPARAGHLTPIAEPPVLAEIEEGEEDAKSAANSEHDSAIVEVADDASKASGQATGESTSEEGKRPATATERRGSSSEAGCCGCGGRPGGGGGGCSCWHKTRAGARALVDSQPAVLVVLGLILINTLVLAVEHHGMPEDMAHVLEMANIVLTVLFGLEMLIKHVAYGFRDYWTEPYDAFDGVLVIISVLELALFTGQGGISALRGLRLLRVFKLARTWESLNKMVVSIGTAVRRVGEFSIIIVLFIFIYSLLGMHLFGGKLGSPPPRANFDTLGWSLVTTFQVLTGENWNEVMYTCITETSWFAVPYFVSEVVLGSWIVLNLFLGLLIDHFTEEADREMKLKMPAPRLVQQPPQTFDDEDAVTPWHAASVAEFGSTATVSNTTPGMRRLEDFGSDDSVTTDAAGAGAGVVNEKIQRLKDLGTRTYTHVAPRVRSLSDRTKAMKSHALSRRHRVPVPSNWACTARLFRAHESSKHYAFWCLGGSSKLRRGLGTLVLHPAFDGIILLLIVASCVFLAIDAPDTAANVRSVISEANQCLTALFLLEMLLKWGAFGVIGHKGAYFRQPWLILDGCIVLVSIFDVFAPADLKFFKALRFLRVMRPLRAVKRLHGLRVVIRAVVKAFPGAMQVAMVALLFFFVYGILGVNLFGGRLYSCTDPARTCLPSLAADCPANLACVGSWVPDIASNVTVAREWVNPVYSSGPGGTFSFDNSIVALVTLLEVASLELWLDVMFACVDSTTVGWAPERNATPLAALFFVFFVVMGSLFVLNLFVSIVVDNFRRMKQDDKNHTMFMTKAQAAWVELQSIISRMPPAPLAAPPVSASKTRIRAFNVVSHAWFDKIIMTLILLNVGVMMTAHNNQSAAFDLFHVVANLSFSAIFLLEMLLKWYALGLRQYFLSRWNMFDCALVTTSVLSVITMFAMDKGLELDLVFFRILRIFRLFRLLRTLPKLRAIFTTLLLSAPAMANVGALMLLLFFMYAVAGIALFGERPLGDFLTEDVNFRSFSSAMLMMIRMSTGESWNGIMHDCIDTSSMMTIIVPYVYFISFLIFGQFMMLNLFVAVILENFEREMDLCSVGSVSAADLEIFSEVWASMPRPPGELRHLPMLLPLPQLIAFLEKLPPPLGFPKHASAVYRLKFVASMDLPVTNNGCVEYTAALTALSRRVIGHDPELADVRLLPQREERRKFGFTSSFFRSRKVALTNEVYPASVWVAARIIQAKVRELRRDRVANAREHKAREALRGDNLTEAVHHQRRRSLTGEVTTKDVLHDALKEAEATPAKMFALAARHQPTD